MMIKGIDRRPTTRAVIQEAVGIPVLVVRRRVKFSQPRTGDRLESEDQC